MKSLQIGELNTRVIVQRVTESIGDSGKVTQTWSNFANRWATVRPRNVEGQPVDGVLHHVVVMRSFPELLMADRILVPWRGRVTRLSTAINDSVTSITVNDSLGVIQKATKPADYFRIKINDEILNVTGGQGTSSLTVVRGYDSTTAASHAVSERVTMLAVLNIGSAVEMNNSGSEMQLLCVEETNKPQTAQ